MDIKKYFFIIAFLLISTNHLIAQDTVRVLNLSFEQCIEIALENNLQLKQSELNLKNQKINVLQSKLNQLPSFNLSGNYGNNWVDLLIQQLINLLLVNLIILVLQVFLNFKYLMVFKLETQ